MTVGQLRRILIWSLLGLTGATILFFILAPIAGFPLEPEQGWAIAQISIPVLAGYLGTATQFAVTPDWTNDAEHRPMLSTLVLGSIGLYVVGAIAALFAFWFTNRAGAPIGRGISTDKLSTILTTLLGIVTITANIAVVQMFKRGKP